MSRARKPFTRPGDWNHVPLSVRQASRGKIQPMEEFGFFARLLKRNG